MIEVKVFRKGDDVLIYPVSPVDGRFISWMMLHSPILPYADILNCGYQLYEGCFSTNCPRPWIGWQHRNGRIVPFIIERFQDSVLPRKWKQRLMSYQSAYGHLPFRTFSNLLDIEWESSQIAYAKAIKLPVKRIGKAFVVGTDDFYTDHEIDFVLAPQSILDPWDAILRREWAYFNSIPK